MRKMRTLTALNVADVLGLVEEMLKYPRPRKLPGKPRAKQASWGSHSLPAALNWAVKEQEYSRTVRRRAMMELCITPDLRSWDGTPPLHDDEYIYEFYSKLSTGKLFEILTTIDNLTYDTRELRRIVRRTRRRIENQYGLLGSSEKLLRVLHKEVPSYASVAVTGSSLRTY